MSYEYKQYTARKLPHFHSPGSTLFLTFRLADSIPVCVIDRWKAERSLLRRASAGDDANVAFRRKWFARFEEILDGAESGPTWLADSRIAKIVADSLHYRDGREFELHAYTIMSNHVHTVFTPHLDMNSIREIRGSGPVRFESSEPPLDVIMKSLKGYTARQANRVLGRSGSFWEAESYDHEVRNNAEFGRVVRYVLNNPVKAGLVKHWTDWKWNYCKADC